MAFETAYTQLPGQYPLDFRGQGPPVTLRVKPHRVTRRGEDVGKFNSKNQLVLDTGKFTIPQRPAPQGEQLGLDYHQSQESGNLGKYDTEYSGRRIRRGSDPAFTPSDEAMHTLRQQNPKLNDYQFRAYTDRDPEGTSQVVANHRPFTTALAGSQRPVKYDVGNLDWSNTPHERDYDRSYGPIEMVHTDRTHRGKGVAEAMFDYATAKHDEGDLPTAPMHDSNRSMMGDIFARRVGGPTMRRTEGHDFLEY